MIHQMLSTNLKSIHHILASSSLALKMASEIESDEYHKEILQKMVNSRNKMVKELEVALKDISNSDKAEDDLAAVEAQKFKELTLSELKNEIVLMNDNAAVHYRTIRQKASVHTRLNKTINTHLNLLKSDSFILTKSDLQAN